MSAAKEEPNYEQKISNETIRDVSDILKNPLGDQGIYYIHDEDNMRKGYAVIFGQVKHYTSMEHTFEFKFHIIIPLFLQNQYILLIMVKHPNLYRNGKVCISILNTWKGEQWTSCQTIRSVLLTLTTLLHNKPLLNEPGLTENIRHLKHIMIYLDIKIIKQQFVY